MGESRIWNREGNDRFVPVANLNFDRFCFSRETRKLARDAAVWQNTPTSFDHLAIRHHGGDGVQRYGSLLAVTEIVFSNPHHERLMRRLEIESAKWTHWRAVLVR